MGFGPLRTNDPRSPEGISPMTSQAATSISRPIGEHLARQVHLVCGVGHLSGERHPMTFPTIW